MFLIYFLFTICNVLIYNDKCILINKCNISNMCLVLIFSYLNMCIISTIMFVVVL